MDHHVVAFSELSVAELADESFLRSGGPRLVAKIQPGIIRRGSRVRSLSQQSRAGHPLPHQEGVAYGRE